VMKDAVPRRWTQGAAPAADVPSQTRPSARYGTYMEAGAGMAVFGNAGAGKERVLRRRPERVLRRTTV
jgi:hypothetical protein